MRRIFKKASAVHIWLGEEADNSAMAMSLVRRLGGITPKGPGEPVIQYPDITADQKILHWKAPAALFQRPWWERVWVRQEVAVAQGLMVHCGDSTCRFFELIATARGLGYLTDKLRFERLQPEASKTGNPKTMPGILKTPYFHQANQLSDIQTKASRGTTYINLKELMFHTC